MPIKLTGFDSLALERLLAMLAILSILIVLSASWLGRFSVSFEANELCKQGVQTYCDRSP